MKFFPLPQPLILVICLVIALGGSARAEVTAPPVHLFILSGQSNMAGLDPARTFTPLVSQAFGADRVLVVKDAQGGQPIHRWWHDWQMEGATLPKRRGDLYDRLLMKVRAAVGSRTVQSVSFVWMQGERDARMGWGAVYREALEGVVARLRRDLRRDDINVVVGRLSDFDLANRRYPDWTRVRHAQVAFAAASSRRAWVNTDDLNDGRNRRGRAIVNDLHLSPDGYDTLGVRFAERAIALIRRHRKPNIVLVMADDQGWGDTGYNGHPFVRTPTLDRMATEGLVFDRFYAAAPVCSPTRASVLTGRHPIRTNVPNHGHYLRPQEHTLPEALGAVGYRTAIFGKYHLGSGQPGTPCNPGGAGFHEWTIGLNFFDRDPFLSRNGLVEQRKGQGSRLAVDDAIDFLLRHHEGDRPLFTVVWFPSPHDPHREAPSGPALYEGKKGAGYFREITLLDQELGRLRRALRELEIADDTILWYCSDNGGLMKSSSGGRARKGSVYEGGLRVPAILEWPRRGLAGRCAVPATTSDMMPTLTSLIGLGHHAPHPLDGVDLSAQITGRATRRPRPMGFWHRFRPGEATWSDRILGEIAAKQASEAPLPHNERRLRKNVDRFPEVAEDAAEGHAAWTDWPWKLHRINGDTYELYHLGDDPMEARDLAPLPAHRARIARMRNELTAWMRSVVRSFRGEDYAAPK